MNKSLIAAASLLLTAGPGQLLASPPASRCISAIPSDLDLGNGVPGTAFDGSACTMRRVCGDTAPDALAWLRLSRCEPVPATVATPAPKLPKSRPPAGRSR
jgi:hypothetical protein